MSSHGVVSASADFVSPSSYFNSSDIFKHKKVKLPTTDNTVKMMNRVDYSAPDFRTTPATMLPIIDDIIKMAQKKELKNP